jgi:hypothetical protein
MILLSCPVEAHLNTRAGQAGCSGNIDTLLVRVSLPAASGLAPHAGSCTILAIVYRLGIMGRDAIYFPEL